MPRDILIYSAFRTQPQMVTGQNDFEKFCEFAFFLTHTVAVRYNVSQRSGLSAGLCKVNLGWDDLI